MLAKALDAQNNKSSAEMADYFPKIGLRKNLLKIQYIPPGMKKNPYVINGQEVTLSKSMNSIAPPG